MKRKLQLLVELLWPFVLSFACFGITVWAIKGGAEVLGYITSIIMFIVGLAFALLGTLILFGYSFIRD